MNASFRWKFVKWTLASWTVAVLLSIFLMHTVHTGPFLIAIFLGIGWPFFVFFNENSTPSVVLTLAVELGYIGLLCFLVAWFRKFR